MKHKPEDIDRIAAEVNAVHNLKEGSSTARIIVHMGTCGIASGVKPVLEAFQSDLDASGRTDILFSTTGCAGLCSHEPMATIEIEGEEPVKYVELTSKKAHEIFKSHVIEGNSIAEYALGMGYERMA